MKRLIAVALLLTLALAGCGETTADLKRDAQFAKTCHAQGGKVYYSAGNGTIACDFTDYAK